MSVSDTWNVIPTVKATYAKSLVVGILVVGLEVDAADGLGVELVRVVQREHRVHDDPRERDREQADHGERGPARVVRVARLHEIETRADEAGEARGDEQQRRRHPVRCPRESRAACVSAGEKRPTVTHTHTRTRTAAASHATSAANCHGARNIATMPTSNPAIATTTRRCAAVGSRMSPPISVAAPSYPVTARNVYPCRRSRPWLAVDNPRRALRACASLAGMPTDDAVATLPTTDRTTLRRKRERGARNAPLVDAVLDEALVCHVGFVAEHGPVVLPMTFVRVGDVVYLHGAAGNDMLRHLADGVDVCVTVTLLDGLVFARSAFHHSMNYRSVVLYGRAVRVTDAKELQTMAAALLDHLAPGRSADARPPTDAELRATLVLRLPVSEGSAKVRTGGPIDDAEDLDLPVWAGEVPLRLVRQAPVPDTAGAPRRFPRTSAADLLAATRSAGFARAGCGWRTRRARSR